MSFLDRPGPRWFTIPAHRPFVEDLAAGLLALAHDRPDALADAVVLLPNRRAGRALTEAFAAREGPPVLLPEIRALGDLEQDEPPFEPGALGLELPPAITPLARRFELAQLVTAYDPDASPLRALEMADALGGFLDSCWIEEIPAIERIEGLADADLAEHWRLSASFLMAALQEWPARLEALGLIDVADRRVQLLRRLAEAWRERPPQRPLIAAGSTGTVPAAADVLGAVAAAPQGAVVLPGLDVHLAEEAWAQVEEQHPQGAMKRLLERHAMARAGVHRWPASSEDGARARARRRLLTEALKPPEATADWRRVIDEMTAESGDPFTEGLDGLTGIVAHNEERAAAAAAVLMREVLETPGRTCALVTPDPVFARRVQARLSRWGLEADSSAGASLSLTPVGVLIGLMADLAGEAFSAATLLAVLKHPLVGLGMESFALRRAAEALERHGLRGPRPAGWTVVDAALVKARRGRDGAERSSGTLAQIDLAADLLGRLHIVLDPWFSVFASGPAPADSAAAALTAAIERLTALEGRPRPPWSGHDGEAAARLLSALIAEGGALPPVNGHEFARMLRQLTDAEVVRRGGDTHPRLRILGAIEARFLRADRMILAGVEEGVWPRGSGIDPFLSRPMRDKLGLPPPERRVGLSAHDFAQAASAPEVFLLHTERRGGQPAVKSRWLWRLETLLGGAGRALPRRVDLDLMAAALDAADPAPPATLRPAERPNPRPPVEVRPRRMSVTRVEEWVRDPYATYARYVLGLETISRPDERVDARLRGTAIHAALEHFAVVWPTLASAEAAQVFADFYLEELRAGGMPEPALAREITLARNAGAWACDFERQRRAGGAQILIEQRGELALEAPRAPFVLTARADRIELHEGRLSVIDFKTGGAPSQRQVDTGFSPQLTLTAAMVVRGAFPDARGAEPAELLYVSVSGRRPPAKLAERSGERGAAAGADTAYEGLIERILAFENPEVGYGSRTAPQFAQRSVSDYDHLARFREWSVAEEEEL